LELTTELVQDAGGEGFAVDVLGDDEEGAASLSGGFEGRKDVLDQRDLLLGEKDEGLLELQKRKRSAKEG
jgi:hypothetical protein